MDSNQMPEQSMVKIEQLGFDIENIGDKEYDAVYRLDINKTSNL